MRNIPRQAALRILYWNVVLAVTLVSLAGVSLVRRIHRYDTLIVQAGRQFGVDPRLLSSLIWQESRFVADRVGTKGEIGLMQVTENAALEWAKDRHIEPFSKEMLFDPATNLQAGTWYLARAIRRWSDRPDPLPYALAEYNAGRSNAQRWAAASGANSRKFWEAITYPTTRRYVKNILKRYRGRV